MTQYFRRPQAMKRLLVFSLAATLLTACQPDLLPASAGNGPAVSDTRSVLLRGHVAIPGFTTKAAPGDVTGHAGVALIDPTSGQVVAGGVTDVAGQFTLYQSQPPLTLVDSDFYTLEATKRSATGPILTLRTTVQRLGDDWTSITGPSVVINLTTTAVAMIDADDVAVTPADTMGKVTGASYDQVTAIRTWSPQRIASRVASLTAVLADGGDPGDGQAVTYTGDYVIDSPEKLANLKHFTAIAGSLTIGAGHIAIDLPRLTTIKGNLTAMNQATLTNLDLPSLTSVEGYLHIQNNATLTNLDLPSLTSVGGYLHIYNNDALESLSGLSGLTSVGGNLDIWQNDALKSLSGLSSLTSVRGNLSIWVNNTLETLGLGKLTTLTGSFTIVSNPALSQDLVDNLRNQVGK